MFKFKKVCALLCSSMCLLGTSASANKDQKVDSKGVLRMKKKSNLSKPVALAQSMDDFMNKKREEAKKERLVDTSASANKDQKVYQRDALRMKKKSNLSKPVALAQSMDDFINKEGEQAEKDQRKGWLVGGESLFFGARVGNRTRRAKSEGRLSVLNNPEVIKNAKESDLDFFRRESKSKKIHSNLLYAGRWASPLALDILGCVGFERIYVSTLNKKLSGIIGVIKEYLAAKIHDLSASGNEESEKEKKKNKELIQSLEDEIKVLESGTQNKKLEYARAYINLFNMYCWRRTLDDAMKKALSDINKIIRTGRVASSTVAGVAIAGAVTSASVLNYYSQKLQGQSDEFLRIGDEIESNRAGVSVLKAVISKNTETVDKKKSKRRTLNQNPKGEKIAIQNKKRIKMGARKVSKGAFSKNKLDVPILR